MLKNKNICIIGYGNIGKLEYEILEKLDPTVWDPYIKSSEMAFKRTAYPGRQYDLAIICVPTENTEKEYCDLTHVREALSQIQADVYLIKSTVLPGSTDKLKAETGKRIVMSPEHSGTTPHCTDFNYDFTILGGDEEDCTYIQQIYQEVYNAYHKFMIVDAKTAEMSKYMLNSYLAMKVTFCNEFAKFCNKENISYEKLRECFILDPRIEASHTFVYDEAPYWDSHCFNKDVPAIANKYDSDLLNKIVEINNKAKEK